MLYGVHSDNGIPRLGMIQDIIFPSYTKNSDRGIILSSDRGIILSRFIEDLIRLNPSPPHHFWGICIIFAIKDLIYA